MLTNIVLPFSSRNGIHIGKSSVGWKFCFNHNDWEYFKTVSEMKEFIKSRLIVDEYGTRVSFEDFWKKVTSKQSDKHSHYNHIIDGYEFSTSATFC
jgi:hypothetical protein